MAEQFDYVDAHATAAELIAFFGQAGSVVKEGNASGVDESTGLPIPAQPDVIISGIVAPKIDYKQSEVDGSSILMGDAYTFFESATPPEIDMMITMNGDKFRIVDLSTMDSVDSINVYRKIQLRR